jgi:Ethanolamine utilization protein EutJ (predicted chaperonin)
MARDAVDVRRRPSVILPSIFELWLTVVHCRMRKLLQQARRTSSGRSATRSAWLRSADRGECHVGALVLSKDQAKPVSDGTDRQQVSRHSVFALFRGAIFQDSTQRIQASSDDFTLPT